MQAKKYLIYLSIFLLTVVSTACLPLILAVSNNNNNNGSVSQDLDEGSISGKLVLPAGTSSTLASIRGTIRDFTGFTAVLIDNGVVIQTAGLDSAGNFRFYNVTPKTGYKIRVIKNRIELLLYTETSFLPGQTLAVEVGSSSTARALVYEYLMGQVSGLSFSQITANNVSAVISAIEQVLTSSSNQFSYASQSILSLSVITIEVVTTSTTLKQQLDLVSSSTTTTTTSTTTSTTATPTFNILSSAFSNGGSIPAQYTADGADNSPPLNWENLPANTQSLALICEDTDAPGGSFTHWLVYNIPTTAIGLSEGQPATGTLSTGAMQGKNDFGTYGYRGPAPPSGSIHHYYFKLYALDTTISSLTAATTYRSQLEKELSGHVNSSTQLMGTYQR
ncbi:YbhB/YbcL family Raf kinase inhibitor-like protein [Candidatus Riflebacteria bacterium]